MSMDMDMSMAPTSTAMVMSSMFMAPTASDVAPMATSTGSMGGMDDSMDMMGGCKISMLWNWNVLDTCFIAESWHVRSKAMFAGSCIGVILLVILLEFLRRAAKEYDRYIVSQHSKTLALPTIASSASSHNDGVTKNPAATNASAACGPTVMTRSKFRPSIMQQAIRAALHMCAFAVAYFVMLLAMYYNGYFIFGWESFNVSNGGEDRLQENPTVCCG